MHLNDDRYQRDRLRLEISLRLSQHEARTQSIRYWIGLSDDRVRKPFRSYIKPGAGLRRHRGTPPRRSITFCGQASSVPSPTRSPPSCCCLASWPTNRIQLPPAKFLPFRAGPCSATATRLIDASCHKPASTSSTRHFSLRR